ncbi:MAG: hypothetical protein AAGH42_07415 [Pseudomonadota bacterium]
MPHSAGEDNSRQAKAAIVPQPRAQIDLAGLEIDGAYAVEVTVTLSAPVKALDFGPLLPMPGTEISQRQRHWTITGDHHAFVERASRLYAVRTDGDAFSRLRFRARVTPPYITGDYQPAFLMTTPDQMPVIGLYTGHFWPFDDLGRRLPVSFSLATGTATATATATGTGTVQGAQNLPAVWPPAADHQRPAHPAFVFFSAHGLRVGATHYALTDAALPDWIKTEAAALTDDALDALAAGFGWSLSEKPLVILAKAGTPLSATQPTAGGRGLFRFAGDALPGQVLTVFDGAPWDTPSVTGRAILRQALVHELVHLWQARIRPQSSDVPAWIHEGAAEAITAEVLAQMGIWDAGAVAAFHRKAKDDCNEGARYRRFDQLAKADAFRTVYACGHMLARLAAMPAPGTAPGKTPVMDFWRAFLREGEGQNPRYSLESWLTFTAARTGNPPRATAIRQFLARKWPLPAARLEQIGQIEAPAQGQSQPASE